MSQGGFKFLIYIYIFTVVGCMGTMDFPRAKNVIKLIEKDSVPKLEYNRHDGMESDMFASGMMSVDCLRCLCYAMSNCRPIGCTMTYGLNTCGYFQLDYDSWNDCGAIGKGFRECANNVTCASQCLQNYMKRFARKADCTLNCEGFSRELGGGPNGCNQPATLPFWYAVEKQPGCKGVE